MRILYIHRLGLSIGFLKVFEFFVAVLLGSEEYEEYDEYAGNFLKEVPRALQELQSILFMNRSVLQLFQ